jgi:hypothetical protein
MRWRGPAHCHTGLQQEGGHQTVIVAGLLLVPAGNQGHVARRQPPQPSV